MRVVLPLAVTAFLMTGSAASESETFLSFESGNNLLEMCGSSDRSLNGVCVGYIEAIVDAMHIVQDSGGTVNGWRACIPQGVTVRRLRDLVIRFLRAHPELRPRAAIDLVTNALAEAFPCRD